MYKTDIRFINQEPGGLVNFFYLNFDYLELEIYIVFFLLYNKANKNILKFCWALPKTITF